MAFWQVNQTLNLRNATRETVGECLHTSHAGSDAAAKDELDDRDTAIALRRVLGLQRLTQALLVHRATGGETTPASSGFGGHASGSARGGGATAGASYSGSGGAGMLVAIPIGRMLEVVEKIVFAPVLSSNGPTAAECCVPLRETAFLLLHTVIRIAGDDLLPFSRVLGRIFRAELDRATQRSQRIPAVCWFDTFAEALLRTGPQTGLALADAVVPVVLQCMRGIFSNSTSYVAAAAASAGQQAGQNADSDALAAALQTEGASDDDSDSSDNTDGAAPALVAAKAAADAAAAANPTTRRKRRRNGKKHAQHAGAGAKAAPVFKFATAAVHVTDAADLTTCLNALVSLFTFCGQMLAPELRRDIETALAPWVLQLVGGGVAGASGPATSSYSCPVLRHAQCRQGLVDAVLASISVPTRTTRSGLLPLARQLFYFAADDDDSEVARAARNGQLIVALLLGTGARLAPLPVPLQSLLVDEQQQQQHIHRRGNSEAQQQEQQSSKMALRDASRDDFVFVPQTSQAQVAEPKPMPVPRPELQLPATSAQTTVAPSTGSAAQGHAEALAEDGPVEKKRPRLTVSDSSNVADDASGPKRTVAEAEAAAASSSSIAEVVGSASAAEPASTNRAQVSKLTTGGNETPANGQVQSQKEIAAPQQSVDTAPTGDHSDDSDDDEEDLPSIVF